MLRGNDKMKRKSFETKRTSNIFNLEKLPRRISLSAATLWESNNIRIYFHITWKQIKTTPKSHLISLLYIYIYIYRKRFPLSSFSPSLLTCRRTAAVLCLYLSIKYLIWWRTDQFRLCLLPSIVKWEMMDGENKFLCFLVLFIHCMPLPLQGVRISSHSSEKRKKKGFAVGYSNRIRGKKSFSEDRRWMSTHPHAYGSEL